MNITCSVRSSWENHFHLCALMAFYRKVQLLLNTYSHLFTFFFLTTMGTPETCLFLSALAHNLTHSKNIPKCCLNKWANDQLISLSKLSWLASTCGFQSLPISWKLQWIQTEFILAAKWVQEGTVKHWPILGWKKVRIPYPCVYLFQDQQEWGKWEGVEWGGRRCFVSFKDPRNI